MSLKKEHIVKDSSSGQQTKKPKKKKPTNEEVFRDMSWVEAIEMSMLGNPKPKKKGAKKS